VSRFVRNDAVELELGTGTVTARWADIATSVGPFSAAVVVDGVEHRSDDAAGAWQIETGRSGDRNGAWARWRPSDAGPELAVHLGTDGPVLVVETSWTAPAAAELGRITPLDGSLDLPYTRRLVDGYDSWAYSGVRGPARGASFWNAAFVADDGRSVAVQALGASSLCTHVVSDGRALRVECGATPSLVPVDGTWGYTVSAPSLLALPVREGERVTSEPLALSAGRDACAVVEDLAALAATRMAARRWSGAPVRGWESWYHYGLNVAADDVLTNAKILRERYRDRPGFDVVQIDDGWQVTYGAWWPNERFPADLGDVVGELRGLGCRSGLWLAPFMVQPGAPGLGTVHPDWCVRDADGAPAVDRHGRWGLDASNPAVVEWLRGLAEQVRSWGFDMVKLDFLYLAAQEGGRHDARCTGTEALRTGLAAFVDALGDRVYVLGCGMPTLPAVGICHGNRVGHDLAMPRALHSVGQPIDAGWTGFAGIRAQARNVAARWAQHGRWYEADPEVVMAWGGDDADPAGYPTEVARTLATMAVVCGGPFLLADDLAALTAREREVLECGRVLDLLGVGTFRAMDIFDRADDDTTPEHAYSQGDGVPAIWSTTHDGQPVIALFNWTDSPLSHAVPPGFAGATEVWTGARVGASIDVPPRGARLFVAG